MPEDPRQPDDDSQHGPAPAGHGDSTASDDADGLAEDDASLAEAVSALGRLTTGATLETSLTRIAVLAVAAIPGAQGAGLTMLETGRHQTLVVSEPFVGEVDAIQYGIGQGPCITAAAEARTVMSGSLGQDGSWPQFGPKAERLGVHSALSLPLMIGEEVLGALNIYAHDHDAFTDRAAELGELFAIPAAVAVHNARTLMQAQRLAAQLQTAIVSRPVIDQAIGILISRQGSTPDEAFTSLRTMSQQKNVKLVAVAQSIVTEAARRARARRTETT